MQLCNSGIFLNQKIQIFLFSYFIHMSEKKTYPTLSYATPLVKEYKIIETSHLQKTPGRSVIKYVTRQKIGDQWKDVVNSQFIDNQEGADFTGMSLVITTKIK